jgi:hypothetical protein
MLTPIAFFQQVSSVPQSDAPWFNNSWGYRTYIDVDYTKVSGQQTNFPLYLDLSLMPSSLFDNASATAGQDIRITAGDGQFELAREIATYSQSNKTGEVWFRAATVSSTQSTRFYIYYGNNGVSEPAASAANGKNNVWLNYAYVGHLNSSAIDSTTASRATTSYNSPTYSTAQITRGLQGVGNFTASNIRPTNTVQLDTASYLNSVGDFHYSAWANFNSSTYSYLNANQRAVFGRQDNSGGARQIIYATLTRNAQNQEFFNFGLRVDGSFTIYEVGSTTSTPYQSGWHKFDYFRNGTNIMIAIDGIIKATQSASSGNATCVVSVPMGIGLRAMSNNEYISPMSGDMIDEFRYRSSGYFTSGYMLTEFNNQNAPSTFYSVSGQEVKP